MRTAARRWVLREGVLAGLFAGGVMAALQTTISAWAGGRPGRLFETVGTTLLGTSGAGAAPGEGALRFFLGVAVHFVLSAIFGAIFGLVVANSSHGVRNRYSVQIPAGMVFGFVLYLINFQVIARLFAPEFLAMSAWAQLFGHVVAFGVPLGWFLCFKIREIEVPHVQAFRQRIQDSAGEEEVTRHRIDLERQPLDREKKDEWPPPPGAFRPPPP